MAIDASAVWDFAKEVIGAARPDRGRTLATVTRIGADGTVWVTTGDGGEAPASSVAAGVSVGDTVTLEWDGATMGIRGNVSNPSPAGSVIRRAVERTRSVADAAQKVADAVNQHFWHDDNGAHVTMTTQDEWEQSHSGPNSLWNSLGMLFRDGLNNLLTLTTEGNARALTIWDGLGNAAANVRAIIGEVITLGKADESHALLDYHSLQLIDKEGETYFHVSDLRDSSGSVTRTDTFAGDGETQFFTCSCEMTDPNSVTVEVNGTVVSSGITIWLDTIVFDTPPASGSTIEVTYTTESDRAKAFTFGSRASGHNLGGLSFAEGLDVSAEGMCSHAEGRNVLAGSRASHAEGESTSATHQGAHAEGSGSQATGFASHAQNYRTKASSTAQTAIGKYNVEDANDTYAAIIGNGTSDSARSNALTVDWDGNVTHGVDVPWTNLQLASSVVAYSSGQTPKYRKWGPVVQVLGAVKLKSNQSAGFNVSIGTLPSGCRPLTQVATVCQGSGNDTWLCNVSAGGVMNIERYRNGGTSAAATTSTWLPFSITFLTA